MRRENTTVFPAVHSAIHRVQNTVAPAGLGQIKEGAAQKALPYVTKGQPNRVVHPPGDDHFELTAIRTSAIDMGGTRLEGPPITKHVVLRSKSSLAPVEKAIRSQIRTVHVVAATFDGSTVEPDSPLIGNMIAINVGELPYVRRRAHINSSLVNKDTFRERHLFSKHGRMIKYPIIVPVDQPQYAMSWVLELFRSLIRVPRAIRDVKRAIHVEIHVDGTLHQGRSGNTLQDITIGKRKGMWGELSFFHAVNRHGGGKEKGLQYEASR